VVCIETSTPHGASAVSAKLRVLRVDLYCGVSIRADPVTAQYDARPGD